MPGVSALPMIVAQCDAVISLVDDDYYTRAWCTVEATIVQTLRRSYHMHLWFEQVPLRPESKTTQAGERWCLRAAPWNLEFSMADKGLTFEEDRPKVMFLERQSKLLGQDLNVPATS